MGQLAVGDRAPAFGLKDQSGQTVRLSSFKGGPVVVYFYPKADTPGCTQQSCNLRDAFPRLERLGAAVVGISPDPIDKQRRFAEKQRLGFPRSHRIGITLGRAREHGEHRGAGHRVEQ